MKKNPILKRMRSTVYRNSAISAARTFNFRPKQAFIYRCPFCRHESEAGYRTRKIAKDALYLHVSEFHK